MSGGGPLRGLLLGGAVFTLAWPLAAYPAVLAAIAAVRGRRAGAAEAGPDALPSVTVILPTYRERANVTARLENLAGCQYPRLEVLVVDSASGDGTAEAADAFAADRPDICVQVIREPGRAGKAAAINRAIARAAGEIIAITDAPTVFAADALKRVANCFADPTVGAATGQFEVTGDGTAVQREEARFWRLRNRLRGLEAAVDSTPFLSGELCCFRRRLVPALDEDTLADDMNVALQVRRQGYRVVIRNDVRFSEPRSGAAGELMETKSRRAAGGIQELLRARDMMFRPRYGLFGLLILPSALSYYLPLRVPALLALGWNGVERWRRLPPVGRALAAMGLAAGAAIVVRRRGEELAMLFFNEWIFLQGWRRFISRRMDVRWIQERSTRGTGSGEGDDGG